MAIAVRDVDEEEAVRGDGHGLDDGVCEKEALAVATAFRDAYDAAAHGKSSVNALQTVLRPATVFEWAAVCLFLLTVVKIGRDPTLDVEEEDFLSSCLFLGEQVAFSTFLQQQQ